MKEIQEKFRIGDGLSSHNRVRSNESMMGTSGRQFYKEDQLPEIINTDMTGKRNDSEDIVVEKQINNGKIE